MNTAIRKSSNIQTEPLLRKAWIEADREHRELQHMFGLMGWGDLPEELKIEIRDDVRFYADELNGLYSSCDPNVARRRERVDFWISSYRDGLCTLETAVKALRIRKL